MPSVGEHLFGSLVSASLLPATKRLSLIAGPLALSDPAMAAASQPVSAFLVLESFQT